MNIPSANQLCQCTESTLSLRKLFRGTQEYEVRPDYVFSMYYIERKGTLQVKKEKKKIPFACHLIRKLGTIPSAQLGLRIWRLQKRKANEIRDAPQVPLFYSFDTHHRCIAEKPVTASGEAGASLRWSIATAPNETHTVLNSSDQLQRICFARVLLGHFSLSATYNFMCLSLLKQLATCVLEPQSIVWKY